MTVVESCRRSDDMDDFFAEASSIAIQSDEILSGLFSVSKDASADVRSRYLATLVDEAKETLRLIESHVEPGQRILEVGGGLGLVYGYLRSRGYAVTSLEPSSGGFGDRYQSGKTILAAMDIDASGWLNIVVDDPRIRDDRFDFIFSNMVLEHIPELEAAFASMEHCLAPRGRMLHRCPNYAIPFEPHYNIPLVPFFPRATEIFVRSLKRYDLWNELHFTTTREIGEICRKLNLSVQFRKGMYEWAFQRILDNEVFRERKKFFAGLASTLNTFGLVKAFGKLPASMATPMTFEVKRASEGASGGPNEAVRF